MRRFASLVLACILLATASPAAGAIAQAPPLPPISVPSLPVTVPVPVPGTPPSQIPIPPGPPTPANPSPGSLTVATVTTTTRVRQLGIRIQLRLPRGSDTVQVTLRQRNRIVVRTSRTNPPRAFRVAQGVRLRRGRYTLEVRVGPSRTHLGPASRVTITIR